MERGTGSAKRPLCQRGQQRRSGIMAPTMPASRVQIICRCNSLPDLVGSEQAPSDLAAALGRLADTMTKR